MPRASDLIVAFMYACAKQPFVNRNVAPDSLVDANLCFWSSPFSTRCCGALLWQPQGAYTPRFELDPAVLRIPIVPGTNPRQGYCDLAGETLTRPFLSLWGSTLVA